MKIKDSPKVAIITGVTGQDGSYLAELLLQKGYSVHGIKRRASQFNTFRIDHLIEANKGESGRFQLHHGDLTDGATLIRLIADIKPDEVYNLGAMSHVAVSFDNPEYTANADALGALRILEAIRILKLQGQTRFYQASTSELYGDVKEIPQNENTPFRPRSPYAIAKLFAYWTVVNYREAYNMFACNGILFNHESPRRGETFVTRKITRGMARIAVGLDSCIELGNLDALRDWGHARDYVEMQWLMMQQRKPDDYVIASGKQHSVRTFLEWTAEELGITLAFEGKGANEKAIVESADKEISPAAKKGQIIARVNSRYYRPTEVETLLGDSQKAKKQLGWQPTITAHEMCKEMVREDRRLALIEKDGKLRAGTTAE